MKNPCSLLPATCSLRAKLAISLLLATCSLLPVPCSLTACAQPYLDTSLSSDLRASDLLSHLTLEEKALLMEHESPAIPRLSIPQFNWWSEGLHGIARNGTATVFPITMGLAATWDYDLVKNVFSVASDEARAKNNIARRSGQIGIYQCLSFWTPNINIFRDPRWGRGQETYGEDPYLTSRLGLAVVRGLQGAEGGEDIAYGQNGNYRKLLACAKHFAVHSGPEWSRHRFNVELLPERDLWETYLPAFKTLVQEGDVQEVMCAYQRLEGEPCCGNSRLLNDILRRDWGFRGLVTSDCWAVNDFWERGRHGFSPDVVSAVSTAVDAGTDLECGATYRRLTDAVANGQISEEKINESLLRLLKARIELGDLDPDDQVAWKRLGPEHIASAEHHDVALNAARRSIVLLQNKNNILPLRADTRVAVVGPNAADSVMMWGNYNGFPTHTTTILDGIRRRGNVVAYLKGCELVQAADNAATETMTRDYGHDTALRIQTEDASGVTHDQVLSAVQDAEVVVFVGGISPRLEGEELRLNLPGFKGGDRTSIELPQVQRDLIAALHRAGKRVVLVNCSGSAVALRPETHTCEAILQAWYAGEAGGQAVADVLYGDYNPSGRLPVTFYASTDQLPDYEDYTMHGRTYRYLTASPLWPFGYGLSYSPVSWGKMKYRKGTVTVTLTNNGTLDTDETIQVYISRVGDTDGPRKALKAFQHVTIPAGRTVTAKIALPHDSFDWWDPQTNTVHRLPGQYRIMVGPSSSDHDLQQTTITLRH